MNLRVMKRFYASVVFLSMMVMGLMGQGIYHHPEAWFAPPPGADKYYHDSINQTGVDRSNLPGIRYRINIGTSFSSGGFYGNTFQTWLAPEMTVPVSDRFSIRAGVIVSQVHATNMPAIPDGFADPGNTANWMSYSVYAEGTYRLSKDMTMTGTVFKKIDRTPGWVNQSLYNQDFESYSLSFHYRLSNAVQIGARIQVDRGHPPYYNQPFSPYGHQPIGWGPWY